MTPSEIEAVLQVAFIRCEAELDPLTERQKEIVLQVVAEATAYHSLRASANRDRAETTANPLDELTPEQRQALLEYVKDSEQRDRPWKIKLLNDWLHERDSGAIQFLREEYGPQWLNRVKPVHLEQYLAENPDLEGLKLKVGDRVEVSNALWEWVQDDGPCSREWFPCTVVQMTRESDTDCTYQNCIVRFDNGAEYEIQGVYQWNRPYWRWPVG
jgi:hypothetical protein